MTTKRVNSVVNASESMKRVLSDANALFERVETYLTDCTNHDRHKDACEAAYEGLYKLMQRIKKELDKGSLLMPEAHVCNAISQDKYFGGLLELRTVAAHVKSDTARKRGYLNLYMPSGQPLSIDPELSAGAVFAQPTFRLPQPVSGISELPHTEFLRTAKMRIEKLLSAVARA